LPTGPMTASGTFDSLSRVLFTIRSIYLCTIGSVAVSSLGRDAPAMSSCSIKKLYSRSMQHQLDTEQAVTCVTGLSPCLAGPFQVTTFASQLIRASVPQTSPCNMSSGRQPGLTTRGWDNHHFVTSSLAVTEGITVVVFSSTD